MVTPNHPPPGDGLAGHPRVPEHNTDAGRRCPWSGRISVTQVCPNGCTAATDPEPRSDRDDVYDQVFAMYQEAMDGSGNVNGGDLVDSIARLLGDAGYDVSDPE